eukprot:tig00000293_g23879.t1
MVRWDAASGALVMKEEKRKQWPGDEVQRAGPDRLRLLDLADNKISSIHGKSLTPLAKLEVLFLDGNGLKALPPEIGGLTNLRTLGLNRNKLAHIPPEIGSLVELRKLGLERNELTALPAALGALTKLVVLSVAHNRLAALPPELESLSLLEALDARENRLASLPRGLGALPHLRRLVVDGNPLSKADLPPAARRTSDALLEYLRSSQRVLVPKEEKWSPGEGFLNLSQSGLEAWPADEIAAVGPENIRELDLGGNLIRSLPGPELAKLVNLTWLRLTHNLLTELPPELGRLTRLRTLLLRENKLFSLPREVGSLVNLRELRVSGNGLRALPPELGRLPRLEVLHLYPNELLRLPPGCHEGDAPETVLECLRSLAASPQSSSGPFGSRLLRGPGPLELAPGGYLNLECRGLTEWPAALIEAAGPARLRRLDLDRNSIAEIPGAALARLAGLQELHLGGNRLRRLPPEIVCLRSLRTLTVHGNLIQALPPGLAQLPRLVYLAALPNPLQELPAAARASDEALLRHLRRLAAQLPDEPSDEAAAPATPREAGGAEKEQPPSPRRRRSATPPPPPPERRGAPLRPAPCALQRFDDAAEPLPPVAAAGHGAGGLMASAHGPCSLAAAPSEATEAETEAELGAIAEALAALEGGGRRGSPSRRRKPHHRSRWSRSRSWRRRRGRPRRRRREQPRRPPRRRCR